MDLVDYGFYSVGPLFGVRDELSGGVAGFGGPAVVYVDVWGWGLVLLLGGVVGL